MEQALLMTDGTADLEFFLCKDSWEIKDHTFIQQRAPRRGHGMEKALSLVPWVPNDKQYTTPRWRSSWSMWSGYSGECEVMKARPVNCQEEKRCTDIGDI